MKLVIQKVLNASITIDNKLISKIDKGLLVFVGFNVNDTNVNFDKIAKKLVNLRIFEDSNNKMNLSVNDVNGEILLVSQFTLYGDTSEGNRPSFTNALNANDAKRYYDEFVNVVKKYKNDLKTGIFQADMKISLVNDGPCTIIMEMN